MKGRGIVITLKEVDKNGNPTGRTKNNTLGQPDYIAPIYTDYCSIPDNTTTTTTSTSTTTTTRPPFQVLNNTGLPLPYKVYGPDGITIVDSGIIAIGGDLILNSFNISRQFIRVISPSNGIYTSTAGSYNHSDTLIPNDTIVTFSPNIITSIQNDYNTNTWSIGYTAPVTTTTTSTSTSTTTSTTSTTSTTTLPPPFSPLRYVLTMIGGGVFMGGSIEIVGSVSGVPHSIYTGDFSGAVDTIINSLGHYPVIDTFWLNTVVTNFTGDDYNINTQVDGVNTDVQTIDSGETRTIRLPLTRGYSGSRIDVFFSIKPPEVTFVWEADEVECELVWDGSGTTSTTTLPPIVQVASLTSNITVPGPYSVEPSNNSQLTITLTNPAPNDVTFIIRQAYVDSFGTGLLEIEVTVLTGNVSATANFSTGSSGSTPTLISNSLSGSPCVLGYRSSSLVTIDYNSKGCKSTAYEVSVVSNKDISIGVQVFDDSDNLIDTILLPTGVSTTERVLLPTNGYYIINVDSFESTTRIMNVYLDDVFEDYFNTLAGGTYSVRVPSTSFISPKNLKIELL